MKWMATKPENVIGQLAEVVACAWPHVSEETLADVVIAIYEGRRKEMWSGVDVLTYEQDKAAQRVLNFLGPMTLEQIGAILGISRERVRQIEHELLRTLFREGLMRGYEPDGDNLVRGRRGR